MPASAPTHDDRPLPSIVSPFGLYLARVSAAAGVPESLLAPARLDGASEFRRFSTIATRS